MTTKENDYLKLEKESCYKYRVTNKTGCPLELRVFDDVGDYDEIFTIDASSDILVDVMQDGMYNFVIDEICTIQVFENTVSVAGTERSITVLTTALDPLMEIVNMIVDGQEIYNRIDDGSIVFNPPNSDWSNLINAVNAWGVSEGVQATMTVIEPGNDPANQGYDFLPIEVSRVQLVFDVIGGIYTWDTMQIDRLTSISTVIPQNYYCGWYVFSPSPSANFITSIIIEGIEEIGGQYFTQSSYNILTEIPILLQHFSDYISALGYVQVDIPGPDELIGFLINPDDTCIDLTSIGFSELAEQDISVTLNEYIPELCGVYECYTVLLKNYFCCYDPCDPCQVRIPKNVARDRLEHFDLLLNGAMQPLIAQGNLQYLNDYNTSPDRIEYNSRLRIVFQKIRELVSKCEGCEEHPCSDCNDKKSYHHNYINDYIADGGCSGCK